MTPMIKQYLEMKEKYKDAILFFRLGDFYEMFFDDAAIASKELEIALTSRSKDEDKKVPMCGVPYHAAESYIDKLISKGYKVAICEQLTDPNMKGIVERDVVRVVTPGTVMSTQILEEKQNNFLAAVYRYGEKFGVGFVDISTGTLLVTEADSWEGVLDEFARNHCSEALLPSGLYDDAEVIQALKERFECMVERFGDNVDWQSSVNAICSQFMLDDLTNLDIPQDAHVINVIGMLLSYIELTQKMMMTHIRGVDFYVKDEFMNMDMFTRRNLELTATMRKKSKVGSLLWVLDKTCTSMGGRMLRLWIEKPLVNYIKIQNRLNAVNELVNNPELRADLRDILGQIHDMERIIGKVASGSANCRDLLALKQSLIHLPDLEVRMYQVQSGMVKDQCMKMDVLGDLCELLENAIADDAPLTLRDGKIIKKGYDEEIDEYRNLMQNGRGLLAEMESRERERTGIKGLKISFNKVFGYYIEVSKLYSDKVPEDYLRKQTLVNGERYITPELKQLENKILNAEERDAAREYFLYTQVRNEVAQNVARIQSTANIVALLDCLCSLAEVAAKNNYCMPVVDTSDRIEITEGRHPVVEKVLRQELFVPNDAKLNLSDNRFIIITGPNMAGKSTYMRQVAIITLMAQMGSFVPAAACHIGVVDKIFTRVGASDDLAAGQSTFMVEMTELTNILKNATNRSLILLDEIGRGTSTFDGLSIAWAVVEHVADKRQLGARTLFATHYHELTELEDKLDGVKNYCTSVKLRGDEITFLRRVLAGGADNSYGIEVAALAGLPSAVIKRAKEILKVLEQNDLNKPDVRGKKAKKQEDSPQMGLEELAGSDIAEAIRTLDLSTFTPIEALNKLYELQKMVKA